MFLDDDFLLTTDWARRLYHGYAEPQPIIDYHCHLNPREIFENERFGNLAEVWICKDGAGDHYKWRLMRANGVPEELISGDGEPYEKFLAFVRTVERAVGNPIYEWSHLELRRYFGIDLTICERNAPEIWRRANELLATDDFRPREMVRRMRVEVVCTTDDPVDDLAWHQRLAAEEGLGFKVLPTFRPDALMAVEAEGFSAYAARLSEASGVEVRDFASLCEAAEARVEYFHQAGGRLADHGMNSLAFELCDEDALDGVVRRALAVEAVSEHEATCYRSALNLALMAAYERRGWTLQLHMNVFRNANSARFAELGPDTGFDSAGDQPAITGQVARLLDAASQRGALPKCILYSLSQADWMPLATLMQSFQGGVRQRMQLGAAWWFNDTFDGMKQQLTMFAQESLLANFTGMLTDSRSFLSYPRHEYFRRVLCHTIGEWVEAGRLPEDEEYLGGIVADVCYRNAREYFGFYE